MSVSNVSISKWTNPHNRKKDEMPRTIKVGLVFEFEPDGEHEDLFEGMNEEQVIHFATAMAAEDICRVVDGGDLKRQMFVEVINK